MDKTILKKFASESRKILMDKIEQKIKSIFYQMITIVYSYRQKIMKIEKN